METVYQKITEFIRAHYNTKDNIVLHEPRFLGNERKYVMDAIDSTYVSSVGKYVNRFEEMVKDYTGAKYAVAVVNGTAALHISLLVAGVKHNHLVLTQPLSFIATCNAISYTGAQPYFIDIDPKTLGFSYDALKFFLETSVDKIDGKAFHRETGKLISACVPMHTFGFPCQIDDITNICKKYGISVVEDAAESLGSTYKNKHTGTFGLLGTYSFNGNKTITCGGGGMIVTNDDTLGPLLKHMTTQAKIPHKWEFRHDMIGYNYRLPNLNAALACAQMEQIENFINNKRQLGLAYSSFFEKSSIKFVNEPFFSRSNYWLNAIILNSKDDQKHFLEFTNSNGIMTRPAWELMHRLPLFSDCLKDDLTNAEFIADRLVNLPSSVK